METRKQKFLFLYLKTGGGHYAPAKALSDYLNKYYGNSTEILLVDGLGKSRWFAKIIVQEGYRLLQSHAKWIFEFIYALHKLKFFSHMSAFLVSLNTKKYLQEIILGEQPDKILIYHFLLIDPVYKILETIQPGIQVITVVTDPYSAHPIWRLKKNQNFILFSGALKNHFTRLGIEEKNIAVFNFTLDEKYSMPATPKEIVRFKEKLGFKKEKVLLILGGGDGIPRGIRILKNLLGRSGLFEIAFVCGNNRHMYKQAVELKRKQGVENLKIYGYVDFVYELISISDAVITKCGASTFMQILLSKKIPVVNSYIWEQEKGNVDFLVENKLGIFEKRIPKLSSTVEALLTDEPYSAQFISNLERVSLKNGTADVAEYLVK